MTTKEKIFKMKDQGMKASSIAEKLNDAGETTPTGLKWTTQKVCEVVYLNEKKKGKSTRQYVRQAKNLLGNVETVAPTANQDILFLLNSEKYSDFQKVQALKVLLT